MLDFEGTETPGNHSLKVLLHFSYDSSLTYVPTMKILQIKPYFIPTHKIIVCYTVPHTSATFRRINWTCDVRRFNVTVNATIILVVCQSYGGRFTRRAVSEISRQELPTVITDLFTRCEACLRV